MTFLRPQPKWPSETLRSHIGRSLPIYSSSRKHPAAQSRPRHGPSHRVSGAAHLDATGPPDNRGAGAPACVHSYGESGDSGDRVYRTGERLQEDLRLIRDSLRSDGADYAGRAGGSIDAPGRLLRPSSRQSRPPPAQRTTHERAGRDDSSARCTDGLPPDERGRSSCMARPKSSCLRDR